MGLMKEMIKEIGNKSREFYEFVLPPMDMYLNEKNLKIVIDIPGFAKKDIKLSLCGDILSIKAEKIIDEKDLKTLISNQRPNMINPITSIFGLIDVLVNSRTYPHFEHFI